MIFLMIDCNSKSSILITFLSFFNDIRLNKKRTSYAEQIKV